QQTHVVSRRESDGSAQTASFWYATPDGATAFISSRTPLTADASPDGDDLYRYDAASDQLTDLTPDTDPGGASLSNVLGVSDAGSYVFFVAGGAPTAGASAGMQNLYVWHDGTTRLIGTLASNFQDLTLRGSGDVSPNGRFLGFAFSGEVAGPH